MSTLNTARTAAQSADDLWSAQLQKSFGSNAGNARYTQLGMGTPGSELRHAYYGFMAANLQYQAVMMLEQTVKGSK